MDINDPIQALTVPHTRRPVSACTVHMVPRTPCCSRRMHRDEKHSNFHLNEDFLGTLAHKSDKQNVIKPHRLVQAVCCQQISVNKEFYVLCRTPSWCLSLTATVKEEAAGRRMRTSNGRRAARRRDYRDHRTGTTGLETGSYHGCSIIHPWFIFTRLR